MPKKPLGDIIRQEGDQQHSQETGGHPPKLRGTKILVGTPWPEGIEVCVKQARRDIKDSVMVGMAGLFGTLLTGVTAYAMLVSDTALLKQAFNLVQYGLGGVAVWAVGKKVLHHFGKT
jgi:hypothetical protein